MMTIWRWLGIKSKAERDREKEMKYRRNMRVARRKVDHVTGEMMNDRKQALAFEKSGQHEQAVQRAMQAQNKQKIVRNAEADMMNFEHIHDIAQTQQAMTDIMKACTTIGKSIIRTADIDGAIRVQEESERIRVMMDDTRQQMDLFAEGLTDNTGSEERNRLGEEALAEILAEAGETRPAEGKATVIPLAEREQTDEEREWLDARRRTLTALNAE